MREVPALGRGLRILQTVGENPDGLRVTTLADQLNVPRSAMYELIHTLRGFGAVDVSPDGRVTLGVFTYWLGMQYADVNDFSKFAREEAENLRDECNETVQVGVLEGTEVVYVAKADSKHDLRLVSAVGRRLPAQVTALGKAMLSTMSSEELTELFAETKFERMTPQSIGSLAELKKQLSEIQLRNGMATDDRESNPDVRCVAWPIYGASGVVGGISISVPVNRAYDTEMERLSRLLKQSADRLSLRLGSRSGPPPGPRALQPAV